mmetsp:Transcript_38809/g.80613  ORF Transcript_38809/g.80613 Transcript_38809/m.80613 type:complete len:80 (+) Transcript_38809:695-934(+)
MDVSSFVLVVVVVVVNMEFWLDVLLGVMMPIQRRQRRRWNIPKVLACTRFTTKGMSKAQSQPFILACDEEEMSSSSASS